MKLPRLGCRGKLPLEYQGLEPRYLENYSVWFNFTYITAACELWKHSNPTPGGRPMFFKAKLPKGSKNGFKTISCRRYPVFFFSKNYFRHQKSSKNWTFCWFLIFYGNIYGLTSFKKNNCRTFRIRWNITKMIKFFICTFFIFEYQVFDAKKMLLYL